MSTTFKLDEWGGRKPKAAWKAISTAPMDAEDRLLWIKGYGMVVGHRSYAEEGAWYCELKNTGEYVEPTFWQHLPEEPWDQA